MCYSVMREHWLVRLYSLVFATLGCYHAVAQEAVPLALQAEQRIEIWVGTLETNVIKLKLQLTIKFAEDGSLKGELLSPDQTSTPLPLDQVTRTEESLGFVIQRSQVIFSGKLDEAQQVASGEFQQQGNKIPLTMTRIEEAITVQHIATWYGQTTIGVRPFEIQIRQLVDSLGDESARLDLISESAFNQTVGFEREAGSVRIGSLRTGIELRGEIQGTGDRLTGELSLGRVSFPIELTKIPLEQTKPWQFERTQTLAPPLPYRLSEFTVVPRQVDSKFEPNVTLAGTATVPEGEGPFPCVILATGTGLKDRDNQFSGHRPYAILADHLTRQGYLVLRYDDRGVGKSSAPNANFNSLSLAADLEAVYLWARQLDWVDASRIALIGHSEGASLAAMVAVRQKEVAGLILLSPQGIPGKQWVKSQLVRRGSTYQVPMEIVEKQLQFFDQMIDWAVADQALSKEAIDQLVEQLFGKLNELQLFEFRIDNLADGSFAAFQSNWMKFFLNYDPRSTFAYVSMPILMLAGAKDAEMVVDQNLAAIELALRAGGNNQLTQRVFPELNHHLQSCVTGTPEETMRLTESISPAVMAQISEWLPTCWNE